MLFEEISWREAKDWLKKTDIVLIPIGSTEQHGPHCPLGTDLFIAQKIAQKAAAAYEILCAPVVPIFVSSYHRQFPGTIWVNPETFRDYVMDIASSLKYHGARKIIFVNGHGGNSSSLKEIALSLNQTESLYAVEWTWFVAIEQKVRELFEGREMNHADGPETSVMMYLGEELVKKEYFKEAERKGSNSWRETVAGTQIPADTISFSKSGVTGKPTTASKEKGKILFETAVSKLEELVEWLKEHELQRASKLPDA